MTLKAYTVRSIYGNSVELVFAKTAQEAKSIAYQQGDLEINSYIELRVNRNKSVDDSIANNSKSYVVKNPRILRAAGFFQMDFPCDQCCDCELYYWGKVPESVVCEQCGHCKECGCKH